MTLKQGVQWQGNVTCEDIEPLADLIKVTFGDRSFSSLFNSYFYDSHFPKSPRTIFDEHMRIREISARPDPSYPFIWLTAGCGRSCSWSIHADEYVCLTERCLLLEKIYTNGFETWCWTLEYDSEKDVPQWER